MYYGRANRPPDPKDPAGHRSYSALKEIERDELERIKTHPVYTVPADRDTIQGQTLRQRNHSRGEDIRSSCLFKNYLNPNAFPYRDDPCVLKFNISWDMNMDIKDDLCKLVSDMIAMRGILYFPITFLDFATFGEVWECILILKNLYRAELKEKPEFIVRLAKVTKSIAFLGDAAGLIRETLEEYKLVSYVAFSFLKWVSGHIHPLWIMGEISRRTFERRNDPNHVNQVRHALNDEILNRFRRAEIKSFVSLTVVRNSAEQDAFIALLNERLDAKGRDTLEYSGRCPDVIETTVAYGILRSLQKDYKINLTELFIVREKQTKNEKLLIICEMDSWNFKDSTGHVLDRDRLEIIHFLPEPPDKQEEGVKALKSNIGLTRESVFAIKIVSRIDSNPHMRIWDRKPGLELVDFSEETWRILRKKPPENGNPVVSNETKGMVEEEEFLFKPKRPPDVDTGESSANPKFFGASKSVD